MPELPEVETIKQELNQLIVNKRIQSVEINLAKQVKTPLARFLKLVQGAKVVGVNRRAKMLILGLDNDYSLVFHLKMTGQLIYRGQSGKLSGGGHPIKHNLKNLPNEYSHVIFNFSDGSRLFFNDLRQFGWVKLIDDQELVKLNKEFGAEPLNGDFTFKKFKGIISKRRNKPIKPLLMEQNLIAGVGNIYAQEVCFCAGVAPDKKIKELNEQEFKKLYQCLIKILKTAIEKKGTSADNYVDAFGREGSMMPQLKVYGREGELCKKCGTKIKIMKQAARTTAYCPICQK